MSSFKISNAVAFLFVFSFFGFRSEATPTYLSHRCSDETTFTGNSAYRANLKSLLSSLSADNAPYESGFYNDTAGETINKVYGLFLCRGDLSADACKDCVVFASSDALQKCPVEKDTVIWYDECLLRYSYMFIFSSLYISRDKTVPLLGQRNISRGVDRLDELLNSVMNTTAEEAANSPQKFAIKKSEYSAFQTLYTLVQCTPDLPSNDCSLCLRDAISQLMSIAGCSVNQDSGVRTPRCNIQGGRVLTPCCNIRFELYPFYNESLDQARPATRLFPPPPPGSVKQPEGKKGSRRTWIVLGASFSAVLGIALFGSCMFFIWRQGKLKKDKENRQEVQLLDLGEERFGDAASNCRLEGEKMAESQELPFIQLDMINEATKSFAEENKLGEGGFGPVYKGTLTDGKEIAVKRLSRSSEQGLTEFKNEVTLIAKLQHRNLVRLLACCLEKNEKLLVYEYMPNKSLDFFLFDPSMGVELNWERRVTIINGIARGLLYLHEDSRLRIIHRDLKASNVLLDDEWNPKISDFGMARIFGGNQSEANTNRVVGTYGYMAPEYAMEGLFSVKSDVFSFGVLLLEIISGRKNNRFHLSEQGESLLSFAWKQWSKGEGLQLMDPSLAESCVAAQVLKCIHIGLLCVQEDPADRPTMSSVVVMLGSETITLPRPTQPAFSVGRVVPVQIQSTSTGNICSVNEVTLSNVSPR